MRFGCRRGGRGGRQVVRYPRVSLDRVCVTYSVFSHVQLTTLLLTYQLFQPVFRRATRGKRLV